MRFEVRKVKGTNTKSKYGDWGDTYRMQAAKTRSLSFKVGWN